MKATFYVATLLALTSSTISTVRADDKPEDKAQMMKKMVEAGTPGAQHKVFEPMVGHWKYTSKYWESAEAKAQETSGTSTLKLILGGRFLQHDTQGKMGGMPFQGLGFTGYNNVTGKYETLWMDSMSTATMHGEGSYDISTQTLTDTGEYICPTDSEKRKSTYRGAWKIIDKNNMTYTMFGHGMNPSGPEYKEMEMTFKRAK